jgi:8-oxo-dGTP pyrophosphatase MutT (NUDIX family)
LTFYDGHTRKRIELRIGLEVKRISLMQFSEFEKRVVKVKNLDLPGEDFHFMMAPLERLQAMNRLTIEMKSVRKAAVLCLFYPSIANETRFILILRKSYKGVHSGQVGFPGGKVERSDITLEHTALRETEEEVGVVQRRIMVLKKMTEVYIPPSNFFVHPFVGITDHTPLFVPQEDEVEAVIEVPLIEFLSDEAKIIQSLSTSYAKNIEVPAFKLQGHVVWGATAMMLNEVRELLQKVV